MKRHLFMLMVFAACLEAVKAQNTPATNLPTLIVAPLDGDLSAIIGWQPALGEGLAEMLVTEISQGDQFQVLESTSLHTLINEVDLGESGYVNQQERVAKGGFAGADFMFKGKVTRFGSNSKGGSLGGFGGGSLGGVGAKLTVADVRIDWRLVDVSTRKIIHTGSATAMHKGAGFDVGTGINGSGGRIGYANHEFMDSALGKATAKAVTNIVRELGMISLPSSGRQVSRAAAQPTPRVARITPAETSPGVTLEPAETAPLVEAPKPQLESRPVFGAVSTTGKVLAVPNTATLIVSVGSNSSLKSGDLLNLYETVETKDDKGTVVFTEEKLVGEIKLEVVQEDRSKASYAGSLAVKSGWIVRRK